MMITRGITSGRAAVAAVLLFSVTLSATAPALAQTPPAHAEMSKETREKMAALHEQMATCLRSDKSLAQCHREMMKSCKEQMGSEGCPMMEMGHGVDPHHHMQPMGATPK